MIALIYPPRNRKPCYCVHVSEYLDDMCAQGMASGVAMGEHGSRFEPPYYEHRCPGCQPRPENSAQATAWDRWHAIQAKWTSKINEPSACPIVRGETLPEVVPQIRPTLPHPDEIFGKRAPVVEPKAAPVTAPVVAEEPQKKKAPVARAKQAKQAPKEQGSLF